MADVVVLDACTIITLDACGALDLILALSGFEFSAGPLVLGECGPAGQAVIADRVRNRALNPVAADEIPTSLFLDLLRRYRLGDGETECLVICGVLGCSMATDDRAARRVALELYGSSRLTGSLGLLREAVKQGRIASAEAVEFYRRAKASGAFLPDVDESFFRV